MMPSKPIKRFKVQPVAKHAPAKSSNAQRKMMVLLSLIGALTGTCALLLALAPTPLAPGATKSLFAIGSNQSMNDVFDTSAPLRAGHWKYIYIHHSGSLAGDAQSLASPEEGVPDHFVIGNGDGCVDGEIQTSQRWTEQKSAGLTRGLTQIEPDCISVCLIGNFNQAQPTTTQQRRLIELINVLQQRLGIRASNVIVSESGEGAVGLGSMFPLQFLHHQLLP